jgi:hypothetical protein
MADLRKVTVALNAYPWTRCQLTGGDDRAPAYCAVGALLRYAGVPHDRIGYDVEATTGVAAVFDRVLGTDYGISGPGMAGRIMAANDSARSRPEAIRRVLCVLSGVFDQDRAGPHAGRFEHGSEQPPAA